MRALVITSFVNEYNERAYRFERADEDDNRYDLGSASLNLAGDTYTGTLDTHHIEFADVDELARLLDRRGEREIMWEYETDGTTHAPMQHVHEVVSDFMEYLDECGVGALA